jgi:hypothetical protein
MHIMEARARLFAEYAFDHRVSFYGDVSERLREIATKHAGGAGEFSFLQGLELSPTP